MFRLAILSDIHADVHALADALARIDALACDGIVCCGDLVDYGLFPDETLALLAARRIPTVCGNHDRWAVEGKGSNGGGWDLSKASMRFLEALPSKWSATLEGVRVGVRHASPRGDMAGIDPLDIDVTTARAHLDAAGADVLVVGHTHVAYELVVEGRGRILNPAALLRSPADGAENPPATGTFGVLELPSCIFRVMRASDGAEVDIIRRTLP